MSKIRNALLFAAVAGATTAINNPATSATTSDKRIIAESVLKEIEPVVLNATNMEPWYQSRVTWGAILGGALECSQSFVDPKWTTAAIGILGTLKIVVNMVRDGVTGLTKPQPPVEK